MRGNSRRDEGLFGRGNGEAERGGKEGGFFVSDFIQASETFAVFNIDIQNEGDIGFDHSRQPRNFSPSIGGALQDNRPMGVLYSEDCHRNADQIVEISDRGERGAEDRATRSRNQFLGGGLAGSSTDRDAWNRTGSPNSFEMRRGKIAKRGLSVSHLYARKRIDSAAPLDNRRNCAQLCCLREMNVPIGGALKRQEQCTWPQRSGIDAHACSGAVFAGPRAVHSR